MQTRSLQERGPMTDDHLGHSNSHHTRTECSDTTERAILSETATVDKHNNLRVENDRNRYDSSKHALDNQGCNSLIRLNWSGSEASLKLGRNLCTCYHALNPTLYHPAYPVQGLDPFFFLLLFFLFCLEHRLFVLHGAGDQN